MYLPLSTKLKGGQRVISPIPKNCKRSGDHFATLFSKGKTLGVIDKQYRPEEIKEAYRYVMSEQKTGSVIIDWS